MTFPEILEAIDTLSKDQLAQLKQKIQHREAEQVGSADLSAFETLSDEALWAIVHEPFHPEDDARLAELTQLGKAGKLTAQNDAELQTLLTVYRQFIIRRSQALLTLKQHGVDVDTFLETL
ncbi:MAG: hypothetical protein SFZ02_17035 [bacterium]|nr:hypothetical protein [bacterium]